MLHIGLLVHLIVNDNIQLPKSVPDLWIEIVDNNKKDREAALDKIGNQIIAYHGGICSIVLIVLAPNITDSMLHRIGNDEAVLEATVESEQLNRPILISPYLRYWAQGVAFADGVWCTLRRNRHINITVPGQAQFFRLNFNDLVDGMTGN